MGFPWSVNAWYVAAVNANVCLDIAGGGFWSTSLPYLYNTVGRQVTIDFNRVIWAARSNSKRRCSVEPLAACSACR